MSGSSQRTASRFTHSRKLFVGPNDNPVKFYLRPCPERARIKPMIEHGGGVISNTESKDAIRLAVKHSIVWRPKTVSTEFIDKCVEKNKFLNVEQFYIDLPKKAESDSDEDFKRKSPAKIVQQPLVFKRRDYTYNEQVKMLNYICMRKWHDQIGGNLIWKQMEEKEVVKNRTWQSMKEHFRKKIMTQLHSYKLSNFDRDRLHGLRGKKSPSKSPVAKKLKYESDKDEKRRLPRVKYDYEDEDDNVDSEEAKEDREVGHSPQPGPSGLNKRLKPKKTGLMLLEESTRSRSSKKRHSSKDSSDCESEKKSRYSLIISSSSESRSSLSDNESVLDYSMKKDDGPRVNSGLCVLGGRDRVGDDNSTDIIECSSPELILNSGFDDGDSNTVISSSKSDKVSGLIRPKMFSLKGRLEAATISDENCNLEAEIVDDPMENDSDVDGTIARVEPSQPKAGKSVTGAKTSQTKTLESADNVKGSPAKSLESVVSTKQSGPKSGKSVTGCKIIQLKSLESVANVKQSPAKSLESVTNVKQSPAKSLDSVVSTKQSGPKAGKSASQSKTLESVANVKGSPAKSLESVVSVKPSGPKAEKSVTGAKTSQSKSLQRVPSGKAMSQSELEAVVSAADVQVIEEPDVEVVGEVVQEDVDKDRRFDHLSRKQLKAMLVQKCLKDGYPGVSPQQVLSLLSGSRKKNLRKIAEDKWSPRGFANLFESDFPSESDDESLEDD